MSDAGELHRTQETFGKGPIGLLLDKSVSDGAVRQYVYMHWRYGKNHQNFEGRESIAAAMGISERTVTNRAHELEVADWLVVIHQYDKRTRTTRNFYHIFEAREDCLEWRQTRKLEKPESASEPRKLRKGKGGKPSHKEKGGDLNSDTDTDLNSGSGGDLNSGSGNNVNSGSAYLDSSDPDSSEYIADTSDDDQSIDTSAAQPKPSKRKKKTATTPKPRDLIYDAVATVWFEAQPDTPKFAALGGRIGQHVAWLKGQEITVKRNGESIAIPGCQRQVTADMLEVAKSDWAEHAPGYNHPTDILKFVEYLDTWLGEHPEPSAKPTTPGFDPLFDTDFTDLSPVQAAELALKKQMARLEAQLR